MDIIGSIVATFVVIIILYFVSKPFIAARYMEHAWENDSLAHMKQAIDLHPTADWIYKLVTLLNNNRQIMEANHYIHKAIHNFEGGVTLSGLYIISGFVYQNAGNPPLAIGQYLQGIALNRNPDNEMVNTAKKHIDVFKQKGIIRNVST